MRMGKKKSVGVSSQGTSQGWKKILHWVDTRGDGRTRMQLVGADKIVQPSISYKYCNYLDFQEQHNKGRETLCWENGYRSCCSIILVVLAAFKASLGQR